MFATISAMCRLMADSFGPGVKRSAILLNELSKSLLAIGVKNGVRPVGCTAIGVFLGVAFDLDVTDFGVVDSGTVCIGVTGFGVVRAVDGSNSFGHTGVFSHDIN